jgi:hypothetical protein
MTWVAEPDEASPPDLLQSFIEAMTVSQKLSLLYRLERQLERAMTAGFRKQRIEFIRRFRRHRSQFAVQVREALAEDDWTADLAGSAAATAKQMARAIDTAALQSMATGIKVSHQGFGSPDATTGFGVRSPEAVEVLRKRGASRISAINDTTRSQVRTILVKAVEEGWTYQRTEKALIDLYGGFSTSVQQRHLRVGLPKDHLGTRARLIAVTETSTAYEEGRRLVAAKLEASGIAIQKRWITAGLDRVCPVCSAGEEEGWIPLGQAFGNGFEGPPGHPGCRCSGDEKPVNAGE